MHLLAAMALSALAALDPVPDKTVVLTFDDSVKSHRTHVAPLLKELGFGATFYVTALWMSDRENFMTWEEIAEIHQMGFEIGNHSWSHLGFGNPKEAGRLAGQLALVESALQKVGVPKPTTFAWCGNNFSPEGMDVLEQNGYLFARRGMQPEIPYGEIRPGPLYDPAAYHPLLLPSAGDAYPDWTLEDFKRVVDRASGGKIAVVQFHGVPDVAHPWVNTPPERFAEYMQYLKDGGFNVIALRDLARYVDPNAEPPKDAMAQVRYGGRTLELPQEVAATRAHVTLWLRSMRLHGYSAEEAAEVFDWPVKSLSPYLHYFEHAPSDFRYNDTRPLAWAYPGGRHPRSGFLEGAIDPLRGTKASIFAPGQDGYVVVDLPEAVFSNLGLLFLAHTHIPTIWDEQHIEIENSDWQWIGEQAIENYWELPNKVLIGADVGFPQGNAMPLKLWLKNRTDQTLTGLRTQVCVMLKGLPGFEAQTNDNKEFLESTAIAHSSDGKRSVSVTFDHCGRTWGNPQCPCIHADPVLPDCPPGERVEVTGKVEFHE